VAFHLRIVAPGELTERVVAVLAAEPGVSNLVVMPGAGRRPEGDAVQCDVASSAANSVLTQLRAVRGDGFDGAGPVSVEVVDAVIGERPGRASGWGIVQRDVAPVWDVVEARIRAGAVYPPSFYVLLALAGLIGSVGILTNSDILIVGAMVVGPEYNAIIGVALGIDRGDGPSVARGMAALFAGFLAAVVLTLLFGAVVRGSGETPVAFSRGVRPVADLISSPDLFSVVVAVLAGIVGVVSLTEARAGALIGVFISVTTIPAAASIGLSIAYTDASRALGSAYQLLLNVVVLIVVGALIMRLQRLIWQAGQPRKPPAPPPGTPPGPGFTDLSIYNRRQQPPVARDTGDGCTDGHTGGCPLVQPRPRTAADGRRRPRTGRGSPRASALVRRHISLTACCSVLSISLGSTPSSSAVSFSARVTARWIASSTLLSPTTMRPASPGSMKSPSSLALDRDIPLDRWPLTPPMTPPAAAAPRIDGGKMSPTAAPAATPHQAPCRVAVSSLFSWILPLASLVITAAS
jgi:uncharacterized hydrophobic protein (TIGR00271 family)